MTLLKPFRTNTIWCDAFPLVVVVTMEGICIVENGGAGTDVDADADADINGGVIVGSASLASPIPIPISIPGTLSIDSTCCIPCSSPNTGIRGICDIRDIRDICDICDICDISGGSCN